MRRAFTHKHTQTQNNIHNFESIIFYVADPKTALGATTTVISALSGTTRSPYRLAPRPRLHLRSHASAGPTRKWCTLCTRRPHRIVRITLSHVAAVSQQRRRRSSSGNRRALPAAIVTVIVNRTSAIRRARWASTIGR